MYSITNIDHILNHILSYESCSILYQYSISSGTPSAVIAEIKNLSDFVTVSPLLNTGGLQSIVLHFSDNQICKVRPKSKLDVNSLRHG